MAPPTNYELNEKREKDCISISPERKYFRMGNTFVKRSLRPHEWQKHNGYMHVPLFSMERVLNEGACIEFLADTSNIPFPKLLGCFEDDGAAYLVTEYVEGVGMDELEAESVTKELQHHLLTLKSLKSDTWGGPGNMVDIFTFIALMPASALANLWQVLPPYRVMKESDGRPLKMRRREKQDLVFCHNDLSMNNVIVDPNTLKIKAIIDWEYAGFFPPEFESPFYQRPGPSIALAGEVDDVNALMQIISEESE